MDINLSPVAVSGSRRNNLRQSSRNPTTLKPSQSCHSCSDDQQSFTSDDREKSFTDNDSNPFPSAHHQHQSTSLVGSHQHNSHHLNRSHPDRDLDSPDQDYDFNSRFSPPPTEDHSYHSENHCNCYEDADNEHHDTDDSDPDDFIGVSGGSKGAPQGRRPNQYRQKRRGHRNCGTMLAEDEVLQVTKDTVCIIESEARGGVSSARELNEKQMAASKAARQGGGSAGVSASVGGGLSPTKAYHNNNSNLCSGRSYENGGQSANFGAVSGSGSNDACGKLLDKVCINNSCSGCNKRSPGALLAEQQQVPVNNRSANNSNSSGSRAKKNGGHHHQRPSEGINEFMHGFPATALTPPSMGASGGGGSGAPAAAAMQLASYGPQMKWTRNNIAVTMERYEPSTSSSSVSPCQSPNHSRPTHPGQMTQPRHYPTQQQQQQTLAHHPGAHNANFHHDYSYAYYEPGAAMRHANIPGSPGSAGPSTSALHPLPPNSIQALLLKSHGYQAKLKKQQQQAAAVAQMVSNGLNCQQNGQPGPSNRHAYTTRYGTQENIYEEIGNEDRMRMMMAASNANNQSMVSLNQSLVEEEFRQVHNRHRRVLGELNLSVEAMIMPVNPPVEAAGGDADEPVEVHVHDSGASGSPVHQLQMEAKNKSQLRGKRNEFMMKPIRNPHLNQMHNQMTRGGCPGDALSGVGVDCSSQMINADMDSGFSGSSSGASYVGSLRYQKSQCCPNGNGLLMTRGPGAMSVQQRAYEDPGLMSFSTRSSSSYGSSKSSHNLQRMMRSAEDPGPSSHAHAAMALNGMPGTSATLKPMSKNASFWSRKGWKIIPGLTSPGGNKSQANVLSG